VNKRALYFLGLKNGFPIFLGYFAVSFTFGISAVASGLRPIDCILMSATNFTSAGQFAALSIITKGQSYIELALTQFIINLRYSLMSSSLSQKFKSNTPIIHRFLISFGNTDEVFGVLSSFDTKLPPAYCYGVLTTGLPGWVIGTAFGAVLGSVLPPIIINSLGVALYGMFIAIVIPPARKNKFIALLVLLSMGLSALFAYLPLLCKITSGYRIIILTLVISSLAAFLHPIEGDNKEETDES